MEVPELNNAEKRVLLLLREESPQPLDRLMQGTGFEQVELMNAASWLRSKGLVEIEESVRVSYSLDAEGEQFLEEGFPELRLLKAIPDGPIAMNDLKAASGLDQSGFSIGIGWLKRTRLIDIEKGNVVLTDDGRSYDESDNAQLTALKWIAEDPGTELEGIPDTERKAVGELEKRGKVLRKKETIERTLNITEKGSSIPEDALELIDTIGQLTPEIIASEKWKDVEMRRYDIYSFSPMAKPGRKHPLQVIIEEVREIFVQMGFTEITGEFVESAFWNMDMLFIPQDHPARDMQDTFYLAQPAAADLSREPLVEVVRGVHEDGWGGGVGWGAGWTLDNAQRMLLRTHTTVSTIRYLSDHPDPPVKVFSIEKVFRKEAVDSTHLPEFLHIEGIILEENASFRMLKGVLEEFYRRMGIDEIRIRPGYFPYTEPSLEVEVLFEGSWLEMGGAGIFRPEVTEPLGVKHPVLAWGLGLDRLAMLRLGLSDIRDLYLSDIEWLQGGGAGKKA